MIKVGDIIESGFNVRKVIDLDGDVVTAILIEDIHGAVNQEDDNIGEFILVNDIAE